MSNTIIDYLNDHSKEVRFVIYSVAFVFCSWQFYLDHESIVKFINSYNAGMLIESHLFSQAFDGIFWLCGSYFFVFGIFKVTGFYDKFNRFMDIHVLRRIPQQCEAIQSVKQFRKALYELEIDIKYNRKNNFLIAHDILDIDDEYRNLRSTVNTLLDEVEA